MGVKGLIGLGAAAAVAVVVAVVVSRGGGGRASTPEADRPVLPEVASRVGEVARVSLAKGETKSTFVRKGDGTAEAWVIEEKGGYPADLAKVRQVRLGLTELRYVEPKTRKPDLYPRLEVEDAAQKDAKSTLVTVADGKGAIMGELIVGKHRADLLGTGSDGVYVRNPTDAQSWLARGNLDVAGDAQSWLDHKLLDVPADQVKAVAVTQADGAKIAISREKAGDELKFAELPEGRKLKSPSALEDPVGALAGLELTDVMPAKAFDFPKDGFVQTRVETFDGLVVDASLVERNGTSWVQLKASGTGDAEKKAAELNTRLESWVFAVATYKANQLKTKLDDLLEAQKAS